MEVICAGGVTVFWCVRALSLAFSFVSMSLHGAALDGDVEALRDRIARGDNVEGRH